MTEISNNSIERYRASLRATRARIDNRLRRVHDKLYRSLEDENFQDVKFCRLIGERDQLALASEDMKLLCEEFELFIDDSI